MELQMRDDAFEQQVQKFKFNIIHMHQQICEKEPNDWIEYIEGKMFQLPELSKGYMFEEEKLSGEKIYIRVPEAGKRFQRAFEDFGH